MDYKCIIFLLTPLLFHQFQLSLAQNGVKSAYWFPESEFPVSNIDSTLFTHLICGFADVDPQTYQVTVSPSKTSQFSQFTETVQLKNHNVQSILSIGGGNSWALLQGMSLQSPSDRSRFINSSITLARNYGFYGLDLDWGYPNTSSQMANYGSLLSEWRSAIAAEAKRTGNSPLLLTAATNYAPRVNGLDYPVQTMVSSLDWLNLMAYDFFDPTRPRNMTKAHAALYDPVGQASGSYGTEAWIKAGADAKKLVLGFPYYGYAWLLVNPSNHGLNALANGSVGQDNGAMSYVSIRNFIAKNNASVVYNATIGTNYCYSGTTWIGYDDVETISAKVTYAKRKGLLGYNAWHVANDDNWALTKTVEKNGTRAQRTVIIVTSTVGFGILLILCICIFLKKKLRQKVETMGKCSNINDISNVDSLQYNFGIIKEATNNFSHTNKLGQGGFGAVYRGKLQNGQEIAVKRLSHNSGQGENEFKNEVMLVAKLQHRNLVRLLGFSIEGTERLLVYEFVTNSSLDQFIFNPIKRVLLNWDVRYKIISGIAKGLLYLHEDSRLRIVHRDLKAGNVLLDGEMNPKIADFGLARLFVMDETQGTTNRIVGTYGYMAPEYAMHGHFSVKSDVFSFGVLILEIVTGQKNNYSRNGNNVDNLLSNAWKSWREGTAQSLIDPTLCSSSSSTEEMMRCIHIGLLCIQENVVERPTMASIVSMFNSYPLSLPVPSPPTFILDDQSTESESTFIIASPNEASITELYPR